MAENKNAKTPADGPVAWGCQCGRAYTVTCISSKPAKQEPVAWLKTWSDGSVSVLKIKSHLFTDHELEPLYAAPQKREWVSLTDDEIQDLSYLSQKIDEGNAEWFDRLEFARSIEAKLKEKNQ